MIERHGGGPYPAEDLAAIADVNVVEVRRILEQMPPPTPTARSV
ncbi:hypothetical protein [Acrocarpospora sp. B8E8]